MAIITHVKANVSAATPPLDSVGSFRGFLQAELARRCARNPRYSLRSFARHLGVDHSTLSQILRGKRPLTARAIEAYGQRLAVSPDQVRAYVAREQRFGSTEMTTLREVQQLTHDTANLIGDWYHYAILELTRLREFRPDTRWIARVLGISPDQVNIALQRLLRLKLLDMKSRNRWVDTSGDTVASLDAFSQVAVRRLFEQVRELSLSAARRAPAGFHDHSSATLAVSTNRLPEALARIARFRGELIAFLESAADRDDVYQLEINLFPVTSLRQERK